MTGLALGVSEGEHGPDRGAFPSAFPGRPVPVVPPGVHQILRGDCGNPWPSLGLAQSDSGLVDLREHRSHELGPCLDQGRTTADDSRILHQEVQGLLETHGHGESLEGEVEGNVRGDPEGDSGAGETRGG